MIRDIYHNSIAHHRKNEDTLHNTKMKKSFSIKNIKIRYVAIVKNDKQKIMPKLFLDNFKEHGNKNDDKQATSPRMHSLSTNNLFCQNNTQKKNNNSVIKMNIGNLNNENVHCYKNSNPIQNAAMKISPLSLKELSFQKKKKQYFKTKIQEPLIVYYNTNSNYKNTQETKSSNEDTEENGIIKIPHKTSTNTIKGRTNVNNDIPSNLQSIIQNNLRNNSILPLNNNYDTVHGNYTIAIESRNNFANQTPNQNKIQSYVRQSYGRINEVPRDEEQITLDDSPTDIPHVRIPMFNSKLLPNYLFSQLDHKKEEYIKLKRIIFEFLDPKTLIQLTSQVSPEHEKFIQKILGKFFINKILYDRRRNDFRKKIIKSVFNYMTIPKKKLREMYTDNLYNSSHKYQEQIEKDITRTFPMDDTFKKGQSNLLKLSQILTAYSNYNANIGYAQGLNFLVGNSIFLFKKDEDVFGFIDGMINRFELVKLYGITSNDLNYRLNKISKLIQSYCPDIYTFLSDNYLNPEFFTANWTLTLFSCHMNKEHLFIIWNFMIVFGWKFFDWFIISLLCNFRNTILTYEPTKLSFLMKNIFKSPRFKNDFNSIIKDTIKKISN